MTIADVTRGERGFTITWDDQSVAEFPFVWLRDNAPESFHPDTRERVFDLTTVDPDIAPETFALESDELVIGWPEASTPSIYSGSWLHSHRPGLGRADPSVVERTHWDSNSLSEIPRAVAENCFGDPVELRETLRTLKRFGILIIDNMEDARDASKAFGHRVGLRRQTNFGDMFEVISKPAPNNLAYTSLALPLHTDLPNQEHIPGYQLLHCYRNTAVGGESVFADGFKICEDLRRESPEDYELLKNVAIPWRFHDDDHDIRRRRPVVRENDDGTFDYFAFNAAIADLPDMDTAMLYRYYPAYQRLMKRVRQPRYAVHHALRPGEMVVFENARVLHARTAFDASSGERHLSGYYMERNEIDSRIRVLSRDQEAEEAPCP